VYSSTPTPSSESNSSAIEILDETAAVDQMWDWLTLAERGVIYKHWVVVVFITVRRIKGRKRGHPRPAIVIIRHDDPPEAGRILADHDVIGGHRPGFDRVSPHFYDSEEDVDRCVQLMAEHQG